MFCASSSPTLRSAVSTASSAISMVRTCRTSCSVRKRNGMSLPLQKLGELVHAAVDLLPAGSERKPRVALGAKRGSLHQVHVHSLESGRAEAGAIGDLLSLERLAEMRLDVEESVKGAVGNRAANAGQGIEPLAYERSEERRVGKEC